MPLNLRVLDLEIVAYLFFCTFVRGLVRYNTEIE